MAYEPKGSKVTLMLEAMRAKPEQVVWQTKECADVMGVNSRQVTPFLDPAVRHEVIFRRLLNGNSEYSLQPFEIPRLQDVSWIPKMPVPREGSDVRHANGPLPAATPAPAPRPPGLCQGCESVDCWDKGCQDTLSASAPEEAPAPTQAPPPAPTPVPALAPAPAPEPEAEPVEFDAILWARTGDIVVYGAAETEDGGVLFTPKQQELLRSVMWRRHPG